MTAETVYRVDITGLNAAGAATVFSYATRGYASSTAVFDGLVAQAGAIETSMFGKRKTRGQMEIASGVITLLNPDGELDSLLSYGFDNQAVVIYRVDLATPDSPTQVFQGTTEQPSYDAGSISFNVKGREYAFFNKDLLTAKYAGTNVLPAGIEGTANDIKGNPKPMVIGTVTNITPVLVNTSKKIYQVEGQRGMVGVFGAASGWTMSVYDQRVALVAGANYVSQADMEATAPAVGQYRMWGSAAGGFFRLGSDPVGRITADVRNPGVALGAGSVWSQAAVIRALMHELGGDLTSATSADFNVGGVPDTGFYFDAEMSGMAAINQVLTSLAAYGALVTYTPATSALDLAVSLPLLPENEASTWTIDEADMQTPMVRVPTANPERDVPVKSVRMNYWKNYTVMTETDLAGAATLANQAFCKAEWRQLEYTYAATSGPSPDPTPQFPNAATIDLFLNMASNLEEQFVLNLLERHIAQRGMYEFTVSEVVGRSIFRNSVGTITHSRYGLSAGAKFTVYGRAVDYRAGTITFTVWGEPGS